jgi:hypothetical protein
VHPNFAKHEILKEQAPNSGEPSRRNAKTPQTVGSGGVVRRLGMRFFLFAHFGTLGTARWKDKSDFLSKSLSGKL